MKEVDLFENDAESFAATDQPVASRLFGNMHGDSGGKDEWLTPPEIISALGKFDLDPCSPVERPWDTATAHYTIENDGLKQSWSGRIWLNPPYGDKTFVWMKRLAMHGDGIALIAARTETRGFHDEIWAKAQGIFFFRGRLRFYHRDGRQSAHSFGAPSCLVAYGHHNFSAIENSGIDGYLIRLTRKNLTNERI